MLTKFAKPAHKLLAKAFATASDLTSAAPGTLIRREKLQFSKKRLTDWGELPPGEIPEALQYDCPHGNRVFGFYEFLTKICENLGFFSFFKAFFLFFTKF